MRICPPLPRTGSAFTRFDSCSCITGCGRAGAGRRRQHNVPVTARRLHVPTTAVPAGAGAGQLGAACRDRVHQSRNLCRYTTKQAARKRRLLRKRERSPDRSGSNRDRAKPLWGSPQLCHGHGRRQPFCPHSQKRQPNATDTNKR